MGADAYEPAMISIHSLYKEKDNFNHLDTLHQAISIHSLYKERDRAFVPSGNFGTYFNPLSL